MKNSLSTPSRHRRHGFTLVEIMLVLLIIGMVAALAFPAIAKSKVNARSASFMSDLRQARMVFEMHAMEIGYYPVETPPGISPPGMEDPLARINWNAPTPIGGQWDWDYNQHGVLAGISVFEPDLTPEQMAKIDSRIDDGDLNTGIFRARPSGYIYVLE